MAKKQSISMVGTVLACEYPTIGKTFTTDTAKYSADIQAAALRHGYRQKFGDAASGKSPEEKYAEVQLIHASLQADEWERTAAPDLTPIICEAVARIKNVKLAKVLKIAEQLPEKVKTWGSAQKVKAEILKIRAERAATLADEAEEIEIDLS